MPNPRQPEPIATGFNSPEGPAFAENGELYFVNWLTSSINRLDAAGVVREVANTGGIPAGLAFHRDGTLYCADEGERIHGVITIDSAGKIAPFVDSYDGKSLNGANDLVFDQNGVLYFSDPWGSSLANPIGGFYRAFPDRRVERLDRGLAFPNGCALNADDSAVFLAETGTNQIYRYDIAPNGSVGRRTLFARLADAPGPDGMAFDAAGNLWVAHHGAGRIEVFDPGGREIDRIAIPGSQVTNVAFGGAQDDEVVVTEVASATVYRVRVGVKGQRLFGGWRHR
ncbi:MAG TPA: SMP-30/gluconolactonase/LRE family protein [Chloroflexota bacterium]|nr:SMP-30/gluconolactonase/LRE family protein [Chloroflexota bacterium]